MLTRFTPDDSVIEFSAVQQLADALLPPHRLRALLERVDSPEEIAHLTESDLEGPDIGLTKKQITRLWEALKVRVPGKLLERAHQLGVSVVTYRDPSYPVNLLPYPDSPPLLFVRGTLVPEDRLSIAIVGSRRATLYGYGQAARFAQVFAQAGITVVSGGAAGIDTAAHRKALAVGGRTVAVLGCGADVTYPAENRGLFDQIAERGAVISEFAFGTEPEPWRFPTRNRIIAGMSRTTVVIEAPKDSGALITARNAGEYGLDVWAVPGAVDNGRSQGCHRLIQDGAYLADSPEDVLEGLNMRLGQTLTLPLDTTVLETSVTPTPPKRSATPSAPSAVQATNPSLPSVPLPLPLDLSPDEQTLLATFGAEPRHLDEAVAACGLETGRALAAATFLEMKKLLRRHPGNLFTRVS